MQRRSFVKVSLAATALGALNPKTSMAAEKAKASSREFYELRVYTLENERQQKLVEDYFKDAFIPALNRLGCKSVGLFAELKPTGQTKLYAFVPYNSLEDFLSINDKLASDEVYLEKGVPYLNAAVTEPAYERIESSLLIAFTHMPKMALPGESSRIFELRRYEHATESAGKKKLEMFNDAGEIDLFKRLGFKPVFFGETLIGDHRPNLIYMVTFDDMAAHDSHWKAFGGDPEWARLKAIADYSDAKLVSHITSTYLVPVGCSQV